jgi:peptidyl-prolyl cis-trans isomerase D
MLEAIRTAAQSWLAKIILAVITIPFALWGVESYVRTTPGQDSVATVGGDKISSVEFNNAVRNQLDQFRAQFGKEIDASIMDNPEMRKSVLDQLIDQRLLVQAVKSSNLTVSDEALRDWISNEPSFQENGAFSPVRYQSMLQGRGSSAASFESLLRADLARQQFVESIAVNGITSNSSVQQYFLAVDQSREVAIVNLTPEPFQAKVKVTSEQAKAYYDSKPLEFTIPEQVRAEYVEFSIDALAPTIQVPADEIKKAYEGSSARYIQKEERKASHILISAAKDASDADKATAKAKADALYAQVVKSPKDFADLAKKNSQDPGSAVNGGDLGFFARGAMVKPFDDAAFAAKKDEIVGPVLSDFGYHIIRVTDVRPEKSKSLAEVTPEIEGELKKQLAQKKFSELAEKFTNAAYEQSSTLKAAAEAAGMPIKQSAWISKGAGSAPPFTNPKLMTAMFSDAVIKDKRNSEAVEVAPNSLVVARALETKPSAMRPLAEVEPGIIARLSREEALKLAKADGEAKLAALKAGKPEVTFPAALAINRTNPGGLAPNVVDAAMKANATTLPTFVGVDNANGGYTLIQISKVIEPAVTDEAKLKAAKTRVDQAVTQQKLQATVAALRATSNVIIAKNALDKKAEQ